MALHGILNQISLLESGPFAVESEGIEKANSVQLVIEELVSKLV